MPVVVGAYEARVRALAAVRATEHSCAATFATAALTIDESPRALLTPQS